MPKLKITKKKVGRKKLPKQKPRIDIDPIIITPQVRWYYIYDG
jgi:hypothetical protein